MPSINTATEVATVLQSDNATYLEQDDFSSERITLDLAQLSPYTHVPAISDSR